MPASFTTLSRQYLKAMYDHSPETARFLGLHEYDGRVSDPSESRRTARVTELRDFLDALAQLDSHTLSPLEQFDHALISADAGRQLYELEDLRAHEWNPLVYLDGVDVSGYLRREYAPLRERLWALVDHLRTTPEYVATAWGNLRADLPRDPVHTAVSAYDEQARYVRQDVAQAVYQTGDRALRVQFERVSEAATRALEGFSDRLRERLPISNGEFALGRRRFERMLCAGELLDVPISRLLQVGEIDLNRNQERLSEAAERAFPGSTPAGALRALSRGHPRSEQFLSAAELVLEELRVFLAEHDIVSLPAGPVCSVGETPPTMRWALALLDPAGPFESASVRSYYYVTPPDPGWSPDERQSWLSHFDPFSLRAISLHEAYPGHYLHFLHLRRAPTEMSRVLTSYVCLEGWAHYAEQMMLECGYGDQSPKLQLAQLREALLRNCRYLVSLGMHTQGMSVDEGTRFFVEHGFLDEPAARREAQRGTFDPGYLSYTLGKLMLLRLREEYKQERGGVFSLRDFHDSCLAYGAPPLPLLRAQLLHSPGRPL